MRLKTKTVKTLLAGLFFMLASIAYATTDVYKFAMTLKVPQVVDNMESMGRRVYKTQKFTGTLLVHYNAEDSADVTISCLTNKSFKVKGFPVTYEVDTYYALWNLIGNNATGKFKQPSVHLELNAQPSYVAGSEPDEDNSLLLSLSGKGASKKSMSGNVTGTLGCGCQEYGHTSPTRVMGECGPLPIVSDVAAVYGSWKITLKKTIYSD